MLTNTLIILASIFSLLSGITYVWAILTGAARPHRTTRFVLFVIAILSTSALFAQQSFIAFIFSATILISTTATFLLSIRSGMGGVSRLDIICLIVAFLGIALWKTTNNPSLALYAAILADFTGFIPTLVKTYHLPDSEVAITFFFDFLGGITSILAIGHLIPKEIVFPLYIAVINLVEIIFITRKSWG